jgi:succinate dehydrogenase/fumarate reductase flavoprotein subunit
MRTLETDVLVIGAGGAGMYSALAAAAHGASVILADRSLIGRGGATVMAQMTVAGALGGGDVGSHHADTLEAGRGLCDPELVELLCSDAADVIAQMEQWGAGWAREADGAYKFVNAPGHAVPRCVYVEFLATGVAVSRTLRTQLVRNERIRRIGELMVIDALVVNGICAGALALHLPTGQPVVLRARATVLATGGLTRIYARNSASANMGGDGYSLALRAGAELVDMEFVQFFPIGHLAPRLVGMDPIMWDAFRYKLGGRLLNGQLEEFVQHYGEASDRYTLTRDQATYAITREVEAGRGSPHGGAWLSFTHCTEGALREAFGPIIDRLARNGIDLTRQMVEVAPIAHYHMGGVRVDSSMATRVAGLFAAGEAVGGANGANRLSGNAVTEALVFGRRAGESAAAFARAAPRDLDIGAAAETAAALLQCDDTTRAIANPAALIAELQQLMTREVGPFRDASNLQRALDRIRAMRAKIGLRPPSSATGFDTVLLDWLDLRGMLETAEAVTLSALERTESRGAHQRLDFPGLDPGWGVNLVAAADGGSTRLRRHPIAMPSKERVQ